MPPFLPVIWQCIRKKKEKQKVTCGGDNLTLRSPDIAERSNELEAATSSVCFFCKFPLSSLLSSPSSVALLRVSEAVFVQLIVGPWASLASSAHKNKDKEADS